MDCALVGEQEAARLLVDVRTPLRSWKIVALHELESGMQSAPYHSIRGALHAGFVMGVLCRALSRAGAA